MTAQKTLVVKNYKPLIWLLAIGINGLTHIFLAIITVPLALISMGRGLNMELAEFV